LSTYDAEALARVAIVLVEPQDVVNIAGTMRAMSNMGLSNLRVVNPAEFDAHRIEGISHKSGELIRATQHFTSLDDAIADAVFVVGTTARSRTAHRNFTHPRELAPEIVARAQKGTVAILFGREDRGLSNESLDRCHQVVQIPTAPEFWSLNLAQAVLLLSYEVFMAARGGEAPLPVGRRRTRPATHAELERMYGALENGLDRIDFFKARKPEAVMRTIRTVLARAGLGINESKLLGAIGFEIGHYLNRLKGSRPKSDDPRPD
jgi:TrmH family RNA methyltransferase